MTLDENAIKEKLATTFPALTDANRKILANYLYKNPKKWSEDAEKFKDDVNKLIPEAYAASMRSSFALFGGMIAVAIIMIIGIIWWVITIFMKKNNKNIIDDPETVNSAFVS